MKTFIHILITAIIFFPILVYMATYYINKRLKKSSSKSHRIACDVATLLLFFSVSLALKGLWSINVDIEIVVIALLLAIMVTFIEWRTKKEIEIKLLLRNVWRIYFLLLVISYCIIWIVGIMYNIWILFE